MFRFFRKDRLSTQASKEVIEATDAIITEMGTEIHDDLIQKLSIIRLHLDKLERSSFDPSETRDITQKMRADFQQVVDSVRRISRRLAPVKMEGDSLETQIEALCQNMDTPGTVRIAPTFVGDARNLDEDTENHVLRMIQELIHNAFRHSAAWNVWVRVIWGKNELDIAVEDDGTGFARLQEFIDRLQARHNSLRIRARSLGATISYKQGEKGLLAEIKIPYSSQ